MDRVENIVSNSNFIVVCVFVAAGTYLPIRCLEIGYITPLFIRLLHSNRCRRYNIIKNEYQAEITLPTILLQASNTGSNDTIYNLLKTLNIKTVKSLQFL
jgi:hypothetical protein